MLADNEVRIIYSLHTESNFPNEEALKEISNSDRLKYDAFRFIDDKLRFLKARYILLKFASAYYGNKHLPDDEIIFNKYGKPHFKDLPLNFSITHSHNIAAVAFSKDLTIGIDIEHKRNVDDLDQLAKRFFSGPEVEYIETVDTQVKADNFFKIWSAKEAYIKAIGLGVSKELGSFSVIDKCAIDKVIELKNGTSTHQIIEFDIEENYSAAICIPSSSISPEVHIEELQI